MEASKQVPPLLKINLTIFLKMYFYKKIAIKFDTREEYDILYESLHHSDCNFLVKVHCQVYFQRYRSCKEYCTLVEKKVSVS